MYGGQGGDESNVCVFANLGMSYGVLVKMTCVQSDGGGWLGRYIGDQTSRAMGVVTLLLAQAAYGKRSTPVRNNGTRGARKLSNELPIRLAAVYSP